MRILPLAAVLLFVAAALLMLAGSALRAGGMYGAGSSLEHGEAGLSQARSYLAEVAHLTVETLARPISRAALPDDGVVISVMPRLVQVERRREHGHRERNAGKKDADGSSVPPAPGGPEPSAPAGGPGQESAPPAPRPDQGKASASADEPSPQPRDHLAPLISPGEEAWLARGGRLVLAVDHARGDLATVPVTDGNATVGKVLPDLPGVRRLSPPIRRSLGGTAALSAAPVFVIADAPLILHQPIGRGDLWLLSCPEVLTNGHLAQADHLSLLTSLAAGRPVFFDEFAHGAEHDLGVSELLRRWHLGPSCLLAMLGVVCWLWRRGQVIGAVADPWRDRRIAAVDGVDAIANLYYQALSPRDCLHLYRSRLLRMIMLRTGVTAVAASRILMQATQGLRLPALAAAGRMPEREFRSALTILTKAFQEYSDERVH